MQGNLKELLAKLDLGNAISTGSLADIVAAVISGRSLDNLTISLLGRLDINISCSDNLAFLQQFKAMIQAHRDRKTKEEIDAVKTTVAMVSTVLGIVFGDVEAE